MPMISVKTARLFTRAASWTLMMLMTIGRSRSTNATNSTRRAFSPFQPKSATVSGAVARSVIPAPPAARYIRPVNPTKYPYVEFTRRAPHW